MSSEDDYPYEAKRRVVALIETLEPLVKKDSEQEIRGVAVPVLEATLDVLRSALPADPSLPPSWALTSTRLRPESLFVL